MELFKTEKIESILQKYEWLAYTVTGILIIGSAVFVYGQYIGIRNAKQQSIINNYRLAEFRKNNTVEEQAKIETKTKAEKITDKVFSPII